MAKAKRKGKGRQKSKAALESERKDRNAANRPKAHRVVGWSNTRVVEA